MSPGDIQSYLSHEWKCWRWATAPSGCPPPTCVSIIMCMLGWLSMLRRKMAIPLSFTIWVIYSVSFIEREFINADMQDVIIQMMLWKEAVQNRQSEFCWYPGQCFCGWSCLKKIIPRNAFSPSLKWQPHPSQHQWELLSLGEDDIRRLPLSIHHNREEICGNFWSFISKLMSFSLSESEGWVVCWLQGKKIHPWISS